MGAFLEQYGIAIFTLVLMAILVLLAKPVGLQIEGLLMNQIKEFTAKSDTVLGGSGDEGENTPKPATFGEAYAIYSADDKSLTFMRSETEPVVGETYKGKTITNVYSGFETESYIVDEGVNTPWRAVAPDDVLSVSFDDVIKPISTSAFFANFYSCKSIDLTNLDTSEVTNMEYMFNIVGAYTDSITITGLDKLNTSKVTNMNCMFAGTGLEADTIILDGIENMDVSNVEKMSGMFMQFGQSSPNVSLDLKNWKVSNVKNMSSMFYCAGKNSTTFNIDGLKDWDTSNVTDMLDMFAYAGKNATYKIDLSGWNVSKVTSNYHFNFVVTDKVISPFN